MILLRIPTRKMAKLLGDSNAKKMTSPMALGSVKAGGKPGKKESAQTHLVVRGSPHSGEVLGLLKRLVPGQGKSSKAKAGEALPG